MSNVINLFETKHEHNFMYGDVPGVGECNQCEAFRYWDRIKQEYVTIEGDSK